MTEIEALEKTILLWDWLARHPGALKVDAYSELHLELDNSLCPLCVEATPEGDAIAMCPRCLLRTLWPKGCWVPGSPYHTWQYSTQNSNKRQAAHAIANAARTKLNEIRGHTS